MRLVFDNYVFDGDQRVLLRSGEPIHLSPKAFSLLELLCEVRPRVLSKKEIVDRLWPDTFVADGSLANLVLEVRQALGDVARQPRYVRTVHGFGYSFCCPTVGGETGAASPPPASSVYRLVSPWGEIALDEGECLIGRASECRVSIASSTVSRHHARLRVAAGAATVEDLGSKNGTFVRGERIALATPVTNGEPFRVGSVNLVFRVVSSQSTTETFSLDRIEG